MPLSVAANSISSNQDYSSGLQAYLDGNFSLAQSMWLQGAQAHDAKSMFNLGLLHQQQKLVGADDRKAEKWFKLAGKNGYPAAYYHLAMWLQQRGASSQKITPLLTAAATAGFTPAVSKVPTAKVKVPTAKVKVPTAKVKKPRAEASQTGQRPSGYQDERYIKKLKASAWTIQMLAFEEQSKVLQFIDAHGLHKQAAYFTEVDNNRTLYKLIYGAYASKDKAEAARNNLSVALRKYGPWLRKVDGVQAIIRSQ